MDDNSLVATQPFVCCWDKVIHVMQAAIWLADQEEFASMAENFNGSCRARVCVPAKPL